MAEHARTSRRDFLRGKCAAEILGDALGATRCELSPPTAGVQAGSHLLSISREAMACLFEIVLDAASYRDRTDAAVAALDRVAALEDQLTVYRETSEVAEINRSAAEAAIPVELGLFQLLKRAIALSAATGGAFEISAGRLSKVWGFYRRQGQMPAAGEIAEALATVGSRYIELDDPSQTVRFTRPGLELNLGAIGKGYALDCAASLLVKGGVHDFLIHGGNSSVLARGSRSHTVSSMQDAEPKAADAAAKEDADSDRPWEFSPSGWTVGLRHPLKPSVRLAEFVLCDQALGTSGSGTQFFHHQGRRYGHIIDPRTGWPADKVLSATVVAPTAELADALSTAFYVSGIEGATSYCAAHPEIGALLVSPTGSASGLTLVPINLSEQRWRRVAEEPPVKSASRL